MSIIHGTLQVCGCASIPETDVATPVGGAADKSVKMYWSTLDAADTLKLVSEDAADISPADVDVTGYDSQGQIITENIDFHASDGRTPVAGASSFASLLKVVKSGSTTGVCAVMRGTNTHTGTCLGGGTDANGNHYIDLAAGASAVDGAYKNMIVRCTGGTGQYQLRHGHYYDGTLKRLYTDAWGTDPVNGSTTYEIANGVFFEKAPTEILEVRRLFYGIITPATGGNKVAYEKVGLHNRSTADAFTSAVVSEGTGGIIAKVDFDLEANNDFDLQTDTTTNRLTEPSGYAWASTDHNVYNSGNLSLGKVQMIWLRLTLTEGGAAFDSFEPFVFEGATQ